MEQLFKLLSQEENSVYEVKHEVAYSPFVMSPFTRKADGYQIKSLSLKIEYKGQDIEITNKLSNNQIGEINCTLKSNLSLPQFQVSKRNPYLRLFNRKLKALKLNCNDKEFTKYIEKRLDHFKLEEIAINSLFEPEMAGKVTNKIYTINTLYHLSFSNKKEVLRPFINLYKSLIDYALAIK